MRKMLKVLLGNTNQIRASAEKCLRLKDPCKTPTLCSLTSSTMCGSGPHSRRAYYKDVSRLEGEMNEEGLRSLGLLIPEQRN